MFSGIGEQIRNDIRLGPIYLEQILLDSMTKVAAVPG